MAFAATVAQHELWYLDQIIDVGAALNPSTAWQIVGPIDERALAAAVDSTVRTFESLRASFSEREGVLLVDVEEAPTDCLRIETLPEDESVSQRLTSFTMETFDLTSGRLFRALLLRMPGGGRVLALCFHHIAIDAWSLPLIERHLSRAYQSSLAAAPDELAPSPSLELVARTINARRQDPLWEKDLDYWKNRLSGVPSPFVFPHETGRNASSGFAGSFFQARLEPSAMLRLTSLQRRLGVTEFNLIFAAWAGTLARWSSQDDFVLAVPVSDRGEPVTQSAVLFAVNILPIRVQATGNPTYVELVQTAKQRIIESISHAHIPLSDILRHCRSEGRLDGLSDIVITYDIHREKGLKLGQADCRPFPASTTTSLYKLICGIESGDGGVDIELRSRVLDESSLRDLRSMFAGVLAAVTENPQLPLSAWPILRPWSVPSRMT
jgi:hypothetical protein